MNIFNELEYKKALKALFIYRKNQGHQITWQELAQVSQVQKSYISKVLNFNAELSSDQLYAACQYLQTSEEETEYMLLLLEFERSTNQDRKKKLKEKVDRIQNENRDTRKHLKSANISTSLGIMDEFYLDPLNSIIHFYLFIERFSIQPELIAKDLSISSEKLFKTLNLLENMGFIKFENKRYQPLIHEVHLPKESPLCHIYQTLLKLKSIQYMERNDPKNHYSFTSTFFTTEQIKNNILDHFFEFLKKANPSHYKVKPENVYQMNFELFTWNRT